MNSRSLRLVVYSLFLLVSLHAPVASATANQCAISVADLDADEFDSSSENVFNRTLPSTLVSAVTWLTTVQLLRAAGTDGEILTNAFLLTVPLDMGLTTVSHAISLSKSPLLQRIFAGKVFGDAYQFVTRAGVNITMGVSAIVGSWLVSGVPVTAGHCGAAAALCGVVYPTLQATKTALHVTWPKRADLKTRDRLTALLPEPLENHWNQVLARATDLGLNPEQAAAAQVSVLEAQALSIPLEERLSADILNGDSKLLKWSQEAKKLRAQIELKTAEAGKTEKEAFKLSRVRGKIRHRLIEKWPTEAPEILDLGAGFTREDSFLLQKELDQRRRSSLLQTVTASIVDQSLSVGVAGGIFLYAVNQWAQSGVIPWFLGGSP